ncbi:MAG: hypothetical protein IT382_02580 [Deltaproteobacteria bacterium]|nr:hypothetical protein [Deltaproteobacteria bacterium]
MRRPALLHLFAASALAASASACALQTADPCNSDDDCLRRDRCVVGYCGPIDEFAHETADEGSPPRGRGLAAAGELILVGALPGEAGEPEAPPAGETPPGETPPDPGAELPADWLDPALARRALVTIEPVAGVLAPAEDVPVLVRLDAATLGADFLSAARERVVFSSLEGVVLPAELDSDRGDALFFWVLRRVDARPGLSEGDHFWLYAGSASSFEEPGPSAVWSSWLGVYHLDAARNLPQPDATGARVANNEGAEAETVPCTVGACLFFDGDDDRLVVPSAFPELAGATTATISATVRIANHSDAFIAVWSTADRNRSRLYLATDANGVPQAGVRAADAAPAVHVAEGGPALTPGTEHTLDAVLDMVAGTLSLFVDGQHRATDTFASPGALSATASAAAAVGASAGLSALYELDGRVDEVRISTEKRSADWIRVDAASRAGRLSTVTLDR